MNILKKLVTTIKSEYADSPVSAVWVGLHWTAVTSRGTGLAATSAEIPMKCCHSSDIEWVGDLHQHTAYELVDLLFSSHPLDISVGMAALNSLVQVDSKHVTEINARDVLLERGQNKKIAMIGHFPFADLLKKKAAETWVLELDPGPGEYPASAAAELLPQADVIGLTATTLMNGTFDDLYPLFRKDAVVVMMGPSTPMHPLLFDYGIDILAGSQVVSAERVYQFVGQGSTLHHIDGLRRLTLTK
jgi:uncharacterized protein